MDNTIDCEYCFAVIKQRDGRVAIGNLENTSSDRLPTLDDIYAALAIVGRDIQAQQTVQMLLKGLQDTVGPTTQESNIVVPDVVVPTSKFKKVTRV